MPRQRGGRDVIAEADPALRLKGRRAGWEFLGQDKQATDGKSGRSIAS